MSNERLRKQERHKLILNEIRHAAAIRVSHLARRMGVTGETIRRDLAELGAAGLLNRTYGGATSSLIAEPAIAERNRANAEEKRRIGGAAAGRIGPGKIVMIDGGSTTFQVAQALAQSTRDIVVITNSTAIASAASANASFRIILCPGIYDPPEGSVLGEDTIDFIGRFKANMAIIGASGLTPKGPYDANSGAVAVKRTMMRRCSTTTLVIDKSKFDRHAFEHICRFDQINEIVTDGDPPHDIAEAIRSAGTNLLVA